MILGSANNACVDRGPSCGESSTLMSAHELYVHATGHLPHPVVPSILERVPSDDEGHVDADTAGKLFSRLWGLSSRFKGLDLELDMSRVTSVAPRFMRELAFLRRHLRQRVLLTNVRPECDSLLDVGNAN